MKLLDIAKAAGIALAVLILDILLAIAVVYGWSVLINPGHTREYYETAGVPIALISTRVLGTALVFFACYLSGRRNAQRSALGFAGLVVVCYALLDAASVQF